MFDRKKYEKALQLAEEGKYDEALEVARKINYNNLKSKALAYIAFELTKAGKYEGALKVARKIEDNYWKSKALSDIVERIVETGRDNKIMEVHGSIHHNQCSENCTNDIWSNKESEVTVNSKTFLASEPLPKCQSCNKLARPNIMMFGDWGFNEKRAFTQRTELQSWLRKNVENKMKIVVIEVGAGKDIATVRNFSDDILNQYNASLIRINPRDYDGEEGTIAIPLGAQEALERIFN